MATSEHKRKGGGRVKPVFTLGIGRLKSSCKSSHTTPGFGDKLVYKKERKGYRRGFVSTKLKGRPVGALSSSPCLGPMAIFSISDLVVAVTLVLNALALVSNRLKPASTLTRSRSSNSTASTSSSDLTSGRPSPSSTSSSSYSRLVPSSAARSDDMTGDVGDESDNLLTPGDFADSSSRDISSSPRDLSTATERIKRLVYGVRKFSALILLWNVIFTILMVIVFDR